MNISNMEQRSLSFITIIIEIVIDVIGVVPDTVPECLILVGGS